MSELAKWVEILWGFTNLNFKLNLKVSAFYLEKQKSFIPKNKYLLSRTAKIHPKDGVSRLNFPEGFGGTNQTIKKSGKPLPLKQDVRGIRYNIIAALDQKPSNYMGSNYMG